MKVIMFPGKGNKDENRYLDVLVGGLRGIGVTVEDWDKEFSRQTGDIFHVHWPELINDIRSRKWQRLRGEWIRFQFFRTINRIKRNGGRVVWTVHNFAAHNAAANATPFLQKFRAQFLSTVDLALSLTAAGLTDIKREYPSLDHAKFAVSRHPHYQGVFGSGSYSRDERARLGIQAQQKAFAFIGTLRPNKRPELLLHAIRDLPADRVFLMVAGSAPPQLVAEISELQTGLSNVNLDLRRIPEEEIIRLYSAADILVFPGSAYFNSGTVYTSLSLGVPVVAERSPTNLELQRLVGKEWLHLYEGELKSETLAAAMDSLIDRKLGRACDLSEFAPEKCALQLRDAYESVLG